MRTALTQIPMFALLLGLAHAQNAGLGYANFIRQVQVPSGVVWNMQVPSQGNHYSPLPIDVGGARFELHTVRNNPLRGFLLDHKFVGTYIPAATVRIYSEDPHGPIPRTRADRPFNVEVTVSGLLSGANDPPASKQVRILRHVQSYGADGTGANLDRTQAILEHQALMSSNGTHTFQIALTAIPGAQRSKVRGEERFSVFSLAGYQTPEAQIDSRFIQIWPVAHGSITGITHGQQLRFQAPTVKLRVDDVYPESRVYAQLYRGASALGTEGIIIPGSARIYNEVVPQTYEVILDNWYHLVNAEGTWTLELLTSTPFGVDRLGHVSFEVRRSLEVNSAVTTME